ncbi:ultraviolet-B receptor UVR8 isoform X2 [Beta vulgaris subsp. vulgaris]|uniref:ultraviolet-B receptor UVR8 isoform X2 n=1 Tax=Beta vulgaris subsp. vulgaris TaxID=3555 RepID=UPI002036BFE9|nr:ultraviolet-B receptor UVR8 isoform X2 [Beta vulgaris subsp. vulgaris]
MEEQEERLVKQQKENKEKEEENGREITQQIWSWGAGTEGQLGTGKLEDEHTPQLLINLSNSLSSFGQISLLSCGGAHVIALTSGGKVLSWGRGASGQLGHAEIVSNCLYPKLVDSLTNFNISHVSAGWNHSGFVSDSGCLFTCGDGSFGQLGHGDYQSYSSPMQVSYFDSKHVEQIACGMRHSLVLLKVLNLLQAIRGTRCMDLDLASAVSWVFVPIKQHQWGFPRHVLDLKVLKWWLLMPTETKVQRYQTVPSSLNFKQAALGWNHALVLTSEGEVFMLGGRHHGVLSDPQIKTQLHTLSGDVNLSKVNVLDGMKIVQIATGAEHSAIVTGNGLICTWGWGEHGQLGLGSTDDHTIPMLVLPEDNSLISRVYCGSGFTFALKI